MASDPRFHRRLHCRIARLLTAVAVATVVLGGCGGKSEADLIASGKQLMAAGDFPAAIIQFKSALQKQETGELRLLLGKALLEQGDPVSAKVELVKAQDLQVAEEEVAPPLARTMLALAEDAAVITQFAKLSLKEAEPTADLQTSLATAYLMNNDKDAASQAIAKAYKATPGYVPAVVLQARLQAASGDLDGSLALLNQALAKNPTDERGGILKGEVLWRGTQDLDGALASFKQVLAAKPKSASAHTSAIGILTEQKKTEEARAQFDQFKKVLPNHPDTLYLEAQYAFAAKDYKTTREITARLLKAMPDHPKVLELAGVTDFRDKRYVEAEASLAKALKGAPGLLVARQMLAQTYLRTGQPAKAIEVLQPLTDGKIVDGNSLALVGEAWLQLGENKKSEAAFTKAAQVAPNDPRVRTAAALAQVARGNAGDAVAQLESIAAEDKGPRADLALVSARLRQGDLAGALKAIDGLERKTPDRPVAANLRGRVLLLKGDTAGATAAFEAALAKDPNYFPSVSSMAAIELAAGKPDAARKRFEALLQAQPTNHQAALGLAELGSRTGAAPDEIIKLLRNAVKANAGEAAPHIALVAQLMPTDPKAALTAAQEAAAALPNNLEIADMLGRSQLAAGNAEQAMTTFNRLIQLQPTNPIHQVRLADALLANKDPAGAQRALRKALEIRPDLALAKRGLVMLAVMEKRVPDALSLVREMQKAEPKNPQGFSLEGDIEAGRRNWDAATAAYRTATGLSKSTDNIVRLHMALRAGGKAPEAQRVAADWLKGKPKDAVFMFYLGDAALAERDYAAAESHYRTVIEVQPHNALALNNVAWLLLKQNKPGALAMAQQANDALPGRAPLMDTLALALAADGKVAKAIEIQKSAISRSPGDPSLKLTLAKLLIKSGDKPFARAELEDLAKLGDKFREQAEVAALLKTL